MISPKEFEPTHALIMQGTKHTALIKRIPVRCVDATTWRPCDVGPGAALIGAAEWVVGVNDGETDMGNRCEYSIAQDGKTLLLNSEPLRCLWRLRPVEPKARAPAEVVSNLAQLREERAASLAAVHEEIDKKIRALRNKHPYFVRENKYIELLLENLLREMMLARLSGGEK